MQTSTDVMRDYQRVSSQIKFLEARKVMTRGPQSIRDYHRIEAVIRFIEGHAGEQPSLRDAAAAVGLSEFHLQRLFRRWTGVSPKRFLQYLTVQHAKEALRGGLSVLATAYETGLSGPGRLHDLFVSVEAVTPGEYKEFGEDLEIRYGFAASPFGDCLIAVTERGVCGLEFVVDGDRTAPVEALERTWPGARVTAHRGTAASYVKRIFGSAAGRTEPVTLLLKGTNFQLKVWRALLQIAPGAATTYGTLAEAIDQPTAARAVGNAIGKNPIAYLIPCHRVLRESGDLGGYKWGGVRKQAILGWEAARAAG